MRRADLGPLAKVSRLSLGGGGLGQVWGRTTQDDAQETLYAALDAGVNLLDTAPSYRLCEAVVAASFGGKLPSDLRITTKCLLGEPEAGLQPPALRPPWTPAWRPWA